MEKPLLIARLAADRARLLHACLGLNEPMLTQRLVLGDWTILNMLAGAGEYDALYASVIPQALGGQLKDSGIHDLAAHDFTLRDRFAGGWVSRNYSMVPPALLAPAARGCTRGAPRTS